MKNDGGRARAFAMTVVPFPLSEMNAVGRHGVVQPLKEGSCG